MKIQEEIQLLELIEKENFILLALEQKRSQLHKKLNQNNTQDLEAKQELATLDNDIEKTKSRIINYANQAK